MVKWYVDTSAFRAHNCRNGGTGTSRVESLHQVLWGSQGNKDSPCDGYVASG